MHRLVTAMLLLGTVQTTTATTRKEMLRPGTKVLFQWKWREQSDPDLNRRARILCKSGRIAEIMDPPLSSDGKRVQIRSPHHPEITLGVKRKYLEFILPPPPTMSNQPLLIDLVVDVTDPSTDLITHISSNEYFQKELSIADEEQYHLVLVNHRKTASESVIRCNRLSTRLHREQNHVVLSLLSEATHFLNAVRDLSAGSERAQVHARSLLARCLFHQWEYEHETFHRRHSSFGHDTLPSSFIEMVRRHFMKIRDHQIFFELEEDLGTEGDEHCWQFVTNWIERGLSAMRFDFARRINALTALSVSCIECGPLELRVAMESANSIPEMMDNFGKIHQSVAAMEYYLSVKEMIVELRKSGEGRGRIAIMCLKPFANGEWIRAISQIMQCGDDCVKMRFI